MFRAGQKLDTGVVIEKVLIMNLKGKMSRKRKLLSRIGKTLSLYTKLFFINGTIFLTVAAPFRIIYHVTF